jgi:hypothetical protein
MNQVNHKVIWVDYRHIPSIIYIDQGKSAAGARRRQPYPPPSGTARWLEQGHIKSSGSGASSSRSAASGNPIDDKSRYVLSPTSRSSHKGSRRWRKKSPRRGYDSPSPPGMRSERTSTVCAFVCRVCTRIKRCVVDPTTQDESRGDTIHRTCVL